MTDLSGWKDTDRDIGKEDRGNGGTHGLKIEPLLTHGVRDVTEK